jgi:hypothetical protein
MLEYYSGKNFPDLKLYHFAFLSRVIRYWSPGNMPHPGTKKIAGDLNISVDRVKQIRRELVKQKVVKLIRRKSGCNRLNLTIVYVLDEQAALDNFYGNGERDTQPDVEPEGVGVGGGEAGYPRGVSTLPQGGKQATPKEYSKSTDKNTPTLSTPPADHASAKAPAGAGEQEFELKAALRLSELQKKPFDMQTGDTGYEQMLEVMTTICEQCDHCIVRNELAVDAEKGIEYKVDRQVCNWMVDNDNALETADFDRISLKAALSLSCPVGYWIAKTGPSIPKKKTIRTCSCGDKFIPKESYHMRCDDCQYQASVA